MYVRAMDYAPEGRAINWKHALGAFYRWQQLMRKSSCLISLILE